MLPGSPAQNWSYNEVPRISALHENLRIPRPGKEAFQPNLPCLTFKHCSKRGRRLIYWSIETINTEQENSQWQPGLRGAGTLPGTINSGPLGPCAVGLAEDWRG